MEIHPFKINFTRPATSAETERMRGQVIALEAAAAFLRDVLEKALHQPAPEVEREAGAEQAAEAAAEELAAEALKEEDEIAAERIYNLASPPANRTLPPKALSPSQ